MKRWLGLLVLALACCGSAAVAAETFRVDDSGSQVQGGSVRMKWDDPVPRAGLQSGLSGQTTVFVRLNVSPWQGRQGRIYMRLPVPASGPLTVTWTTRGILQAGAVRAGERALVYAGPIPSGLLEDTMRLQIQADGRRLTRAEQLDFSFEIDVESLGCRPPPAGPWSPRAACCCPPPPARRAFRRW
jgi:hypothetical protein